MTEGLSPLIGVGDVPEWVIVSLYMGGAGLIYLGFLGRGLARFISIVIGLGVLAWACAPQILEWIDQHPAIQDCIDTIRAGKWRDCPYIGPYVR